MTVVGIGLQRGVVDYHRSAGCRIRIGWNAFSETLAIAVDFVSDLLRPESADIIARTAATALKAVAPTDKPHGQCAGTALRADWAG